MLEFRILGPLSVVDEGQPLTLGGSRRRATLALLLLSANRVVPIERLADELYGGAPPVTALTQVQRQISDLRKLLGPMAIETRSPGYMMRLDRKQFDLAVFEDLCRDGVSALAGGDAARAADLLQQALALWRGPPLVDMTYESFARAPVERLEELRLSAIEKLIDADLALGRHAEIIPDLEELVAEHPLRERFHAQLMLALYRSARQAEALETFRRARETLVGQLGIEPAPALQRLERQILAQDAALDAPQLVLHRPRSDPRGAVLVAATDESGLATASAMAEPLASRREVILARLLDDDSELERAAASLNAHSAAVGEGVRAAAFVSADPAADLVRLATGYEVELVVAAAHKELEEVPLPDVLVELLAGSPADVAVVAGPAVDWRQGTGIYVPFGGTGHDWAALEVAAWLATAVDVPLRLVGQRADPARGRRDASRLLANASLAVQRLVGVMSEPLLVEASEEALVAAVGRATVVVAGISSRWRVDGIGAARRLLLRSGGPTLIVHAGPTPGGLAPVESRTRYTWTIER
jgi:DNA-binding SARP family transcriptional activator